MSQGKVSLSELMGSRGAQGGLSLADLPKLLGDGMPDLPRNEIGRFRLIKALQQRFGQSYRQLPGVKNIIKDFDDDVAFEGKVQAMKSVKLPGGK